MYQVRPVVNYDGAETNRKGVEMTKLQAIIASIGTAVLGIGIALVGTLVLKNNAVTALGILLIGTGAGGLGIPRPQDALAGTEDKVV